MQIQSGVMVRRITGLSEEDRRAVREELVAITDQNADIAH